MFAGGGVHFMQNVADEGGAVACDECMAIRLMGTATQRNKFSENTAGFSENTAGGGGGSGGALWIDSPKTEKIDSENSTFSKNTADVDGGAVSLSRSQSLSPWSCN